MKRKPSIRKGAGTVGEYLKSLPLNQRKALKNLRKIIKSAAPGATELISYQIPTFKLNGFLVGFAAFANHCSFFAGKMVTREFRNQLEPYEVKGSTIHFTPERPLPPALVRRMVKERMAENKRRKRTKSTTNNQPPNVNP